MANCLWHFGGAIAGWCSALVNLGCVRSADVGAGYWGSESSMVGLGCFVWVLSDFEWSAFGQVAFGCRWCGDFE